jgi:NAD(P)-dependent dehydrogenase (short-subunit alcohol dehydrogenase family)
MRLRDKIVLITGAAGLLGGKLAEVVAEMGGTAIKTDLGSHKGMDHPLDVTSEEDWIRVAAAVGAQYGRLDGLVNAAGIGIFGTVEDTDYALWKRTMAINADGVFLGCKYMLPLLRRQGGSIINLSSVSGLVAGHNVAAYNASKGAVRLLSKSVALHGARQNPQVRCNSVHPTFIEGPMANALWETAPNPERARERMLRDIPLGRFGQAREVADMCVYLLSDESRFVTGTEFVIDGGLTAR